MLFQWFGEDRHLRFKTLPPEIRKDRADSRMTGYGRSSKRSQFRIIYRITSRGWWPTAFFVGMMLATPLPWRRRLTGLVAGVFLLDALILARLALIAAALFGASETVPVEGWTRAHAHVLTQPCLTRLTLFEG